MDLLILADMVIEGLVYSKVGFFLNKNQKKASFFIYCYITKECFS